MAVPSAASLLDVGELLGCSVLLDVASSPHPANATTANNTSHLTRSDYPV